VKIMRFLAILVVVGFLIAACSSSDSDDGGTTGGSGDTPAPAATADSSSKDDESSSKEDVKEEEAKEAKEEEEDKPAVSSSKIWLDAFDWNCSSNWTDRDGALGLKAYSGSGTCKTEFPGAPGTYQLVLTAQTEFDGKSPYKLSINGNQVANGEYPLSSPLGCDCPTDDWRDVCPDRNRDIDLGSHELNTGDTLTFWGDDVYPCGSHGSYTKWHGITAIKR